MAYEDNDDNGFSGPPRGGDREERATEAREATVERVLWERPGNPRKLLKMSDGHSWAGKVGESVGKGYIIRAAGYWKPASNPRYGDTFEIEQVIEILPYSKDGLRTWLMDRLPEIGEKRAEELAKKFPGELLFSVIQDDPMQLTAVKGITEARAMEIQRVYKIYAHERAIVTELVSLGIDYTMAQSAVHDLGVGGLKTTLKTDPFDLVDLPGWTFNNVKLFVLRPDNTAYGMPEHDPRIVKAYARDVLEKLTQGDKDMGREGGDCFLTERDIFFKLKGYQSFYTLKQLAEILRTSKHLRVRTQSLLLERLDSAEVNIANVLRSKSGQDVVVEPVELPEFLDPSQRVAAEALAFSPLAVMTGGPGTGKTTTLKSALDVMGARGEIVKLASPTGKAAKRMTETTGHPAQTIHRLLEWTPEGFKRDENNPIEADVIVIDESSMLDVELASALMSAVGGARLILVGDEDQLPPVGPGQVLTDIMKARTDDEHVVPVYRLTKTHRQAGDNWVIDNAKTIISGRVPSLKDMSSEHGSFQFREFRTSKEIIADVVKIYDHARSSGYLKELQVLCPMKMPGRGASTFEINMAVQKHMIPASNYDSGDTFVDGGDKYKIYVGDKVIYTKNSPKLGLVNGDTGYVEAIEMHGPSVQDTVMLVRIDGLENDKREDGLFELRGEYFKSVLLAYAITIHKSQGSEWKNVVVVMDPEHGRMLKRQLLYTAVTRTSKNLRIVGSRAAVEAAATSPRQNERWTKLSQRITGEPV